MLENRSHHDHPDNNEEFRRQVATRLLAKFPRERVEQLYTSQESETGGQKLFPYFRLDKAMLTYYLSTHALQDVDENSYGIPELLDYQTARMRAFAIAAWVEIGCGGMDNLAQSDLSKNWTFISGGHFISEQERAPLILAEGAEDYRKMMQHYVALRSVWEQRLSDAFAEDTSLEPEPDPFQEHQAAELLLPFLTE